MTLTKISDPDTTIPQDTATPPHMGQMIQQYLAGKKLAGSWLAENLGVHRTSVYKMLRRESIDTSTLYKITVLLKHDFFEPLSEYFRIKDKPVLPLK